MHIAVIGAGTAGRGFAVECALAGFLVTLEDVMPSRLRHAEAIFSSLGKQVQLAMTVEEAVQDADFVVDFVPDELESKLEIFSLLDRMAPPKTIFCTPSEVLSITDLASCTYRPECCIMVRGINLNSGAVRLLTGHLTSAQTLDTAVRVWRGMGVDAWPEPDPDLPMLMKNMRDAGLSCNR